MLLLGLFSLLLAPAQAQEPTAQDVQSGTSPARTAQMEDIRRSQNQFVISKALDAGDVFYNTGDYTKAEERYRFALNSSSPEGITAKFYARASGGLARVRIAQAADARKNSDYPRAFALLNDAVQFDPSTKPVVDQQIALTKQEQIKDRDERRNPEGIAKNPVVTPEFKDQVAAVQRLLFEGDRFFETGQYARADERYRQVLVIDQYNKAARQKLERLERYKQRAAEVAHATSREDAIYDIERRWSQRELPEVAQNGGEAAPATESNIARLSNKLAAIKIDNISFVGTPVDDAIRILQDKAKQADPTGEGINFVLKLRPTVVPAAPGAPGARGGAAAVAATEAPASSAPPSVTLSLNNVSLAEVLRLLTQLTNLKYKVEEYAVFILPSTESSDVLIPRTFLVPPGFFVGGLTAPKSTTSRTGTTSIATTVESIKADVKQQLIDQGVDFPPGATAAYLSGSSKLVVKNTPDQMDRIDALIQAASQEEDPQVEIETKFAEFTDNALHELVVNWAIAANHHTDQNQVLSTDPNLTNGNGNLTALNTPAANSILSSGRTALRGAADLQEDSLDGLLQTPPSGIPSVNGTVQTYSQASFFMGGVLGGKAFGVLATMIDQMKGVDLLSAPKITTKNRTQAKIEISQQMTYPNQFTAPTYNGSLVQYNGQATDLVTPPNPSSFDKASIGVTMDVTPVAYADKRIDLELKPEVTDFEGFIDYGAAIEEGSTLDPTISPLEIYHIRQPVFNNRKITTKLQVIDGQTVVMGGLVREDTQVIDDKVPILGDLPLVGRAFRSKIDQKTKRNLIIFITARIIRSTGKPKFAMIDASLAQPTPPVPVDTVVTAASNDSKSLVNPAATGTAPAAAALPTR
jgi:general secretion pathway protein D